MKNPEISVLLPAYNSAKYIKESVLSILKQSYKDFELIIINDGSTDKTMKVVSELQDERIVLINNSKNLGVSKSLNLGLKIAKGKYIARCDSDDVNDLDRFKKQRIFLKKNKKYVLVGSNAFLINKNGEIIGVKKYPESDKELRKKLIIRNQILHPSVFYRKAVAMKVGGYSNFLNGAEDYDFFLKLSQFGKLCNLQENLVKRRIHDQVITKKMHFKIEVLAIFVRLIHLRKLLLSL